MRALFRDDHIDLATSKLDNSVSQREECIVASAANVMTGQMGRTLLTDNDRSDRDFLPAVSLDSQELRIAIASVS
jgi:hypothetical protein